MNELINEISGIIKKVDNNEPISFFDMLLLDYYVLYSPIIIKSINLIIKKYKEEK